MARRRPRSAAPDPARQYGSSRTRTAPATADGRLLRAALGVTPNPDDVAAAKREGRPPRRIPADRFAVDHLRVSPSTLDRYVRGKLPVPEHVVERAERIVAAAKRAGRVVDDPDAAPLAPLTRYRKGEITYAEYAVLQRAGRDAPEHAPEREPAAAVM